MERRQFKRQPIEGDEGLEVSICLDSYSLLREGQTEEFELRGQATDISLGGLGLRLHVVADLVTLHPNHQVMVRFRQDETERAVPARIAHFDETRAKLGVEFNSPLQSFNLFN